MPPNRLHAQRWYRLTAAHPYRSLLAGRTFCPLELGSLGLMGELAMVTTNNARMLSPSIFTGQCHEKSSLYH